MIKVSVWGVRDDKFGDDKFGDDKFGDDGINQRMSSA